MTSNDRLTQFCRPQKRFQVKTPCYGAFFQKMHFFINFCVTRVKKVSKRHGLTTVRGLFRYFRTLQGKSFKKTAPPFKSFLILFQSYSLFYILTILFKSFHFSLDFNFLQSFSSFFNVPQPFLILFSFFSLHNFLIYPLSSDFNFLQTCSIFSSFLNLFQSFFTVFENSCWHWRC